MPVVNTSKARSGGAFTRIHLRTGAGVMVRGRWLPKAELERMLDEIAAANR